MGAAVRELVRRRKAERRLQLRRPPRRGWAGRPRRVPLGGRAGRHAHAHVRGAPARGRADGEPSEGGRRRQGNGRRDLHGDGPRARDRDARLHPARRPAHRRLRRLLRRLALRPDGRHGLRGARHPGRGLAPRQARAAEGDSGRGDGSRAEGPLVPRPPPDGQRGADAGGPRPLAPRAGRAGRPCVVPVRADGRRGPPVPDVHVGNDGEAEGDRPHDRRLPRRRRVDAPLHLRPEARDRRLLVRRGHRLDHRPLVHRVRAALQRHDLGPLRRDARLPRPQTVVVDRRALRGDDPLHGTHRHPGSHEVGPRARRRARPHLAAAARLGSRSTPRRGSGTTSTSAAAAAPWSTPGGRPRRE